MPCRWAAAFTTLSTIACGLKSGGAWVGDYWGVISFGVNTDVAKTVPTSWDSLKDPMYKNQIALGGMVPLKTEDIAKKILTAMHLPTEVPELHPARPPPRGPGRWRGAPQHGQHWRHRP